MVRTFSTKGKKSSVACSVREKNQSQAAVLMYNIIIIHRTTVFLSTVKLHDYQISRFISY